MRAAVLWATVLMLAAPGLAEAGRHRNRRPSHAGRYSRPARPRHHHRNYTPRRPHRGRYRPHHYRAYTVRPHYRHYRRYRPRWGYGPYSRVGVGIGVGVGVGVGFGLGFHWGWPGYYPGYYPGYPAHGVAYVAPAVVSTAIAIAHTPKVVYVPHPVAGYAGPSGSIDTDVVPNKAAVYLDGVFVGIADDFDGWPGLLDTTPGSHTLSFVEPGYQTTEITVEVVPRHRVRVVLELEPSPPSGAPRSLSPAPPPAPAPAPAPAAPYPAPAVPRAQAPPQQPVAPAVQEPGELMLDVRPMGASVYVDGVFEAVAGAGPVVIAGLAPGVHEVEVLKPRHVLYRGEVVLPERGGVSITVRLREESVY